MASTSPGKSPARRRQRSVRVTVAVALLSLATLLVVLAVPTGSFPAMSAAAFLALACAWGSARIIYSELAQSRRDNFTDRAAQAQAYRTLFSERAEEHAQFATAMTDKLVHRDSEVRELSGTLVDAERRAAEAETKVRRAAQELADLEAKLEELEHELQLRRAEEEDQLAVWDAAQLGLPYDAEALDGIVDLVAWEERVSKGSETDEQSRKHA
jgi:hypothetical protein